MGYILNPRYEIEQTCWFWRGFFGLKWRVVFRYAKERESATARYASKHCESRGRYKTMWAAEKRMYELKKKPEWTN